MLLSILVISRTEDLLSQMLSSISKATCLDKENIEILCSWNGSQNNERKIVNHSNYDFKIVQREEYHFAKNINSLAKKASGEILLIINDDIILDPQSIDNGIEALKTKKNIGLVGGNLRYENDLIQHIGISYDKNNYPYHKFENSVAVGNSILRDNSSKLIPSATGALFFIKRELFNEFGFSEKYDISGEDIELCLEIRGKKDLNILFCQNVSGIHFSSKTRKKNNQDFNTLNDLERVKNKRLEFLENASKEQILLDLRDLQEEISIIKDLYIRSKLKNFIKSSLNWIYYKFKSIKF